MTTDVAIGDAVLEIKLSSPHTTLDLQSFTQVLTQLRLALEEIDRNATPVKTPRVQWGIRDMDMKVGGRVLLVPEAIPRARAWSTLALPADGLVDGVRSLSEAAEIPPYFSEGTIGRVQAIGKHISAGTFDKIYVSSRREDRLAEVGRQTLENAAKAVAPIRRSYSSVTGTLDVLDYNRGGRRARAEVRMQGSKHAVRIFAGHGQAADLRDAWGKRVCVEGLLKRNIAGQPVSLELDDLEVLDAPPEPMSPWRILGADPDFTGGLGTAGYLERVRRG